MIQTTTGNDVADARVKPDLEMGRVGGWVRGGQTKWKHTVRPGKPRDTQR